jgi:hypothetical protein
VAIYDRSRWSAERRDTTYIGLLRIPESFTYWEKGRVAIWANARSSDNKKGSFSSNKNSY